MKFGFVVPVYNHGAALEGVVKNLLTYGYPIVVVDDGNNEENKTQIQAVANKYEQVVLVTRAKNGGKGHAMKDGICKASEIGLTHILQIDSDGQHDSSRIPQFFKLAGENPEAIICGYPEYDASVPKVRLNFRKFANGWIHIVTLSKEIKDALIGFRVYPVEPYMNLINKGTYIDGRMGYDIDILVHLFWAGVPVVSESVKITYPSDGISNYRAVRDTLRISKTYARLCLGLFVRWPWILKINRNRKKGNNNGR